MGMKIGGGIYPVNTWFHYHYIPDGITDLYLDVEGRNFITIDITANSANIYLPDVAAAKSKTYFFKNINIYAGNTCNINATGGAEIQGALDYKLSANYARLLLISDGIRWLIMSDDK